MKIVMIRSNPIDPDVRIIKEAEALGEAGYDVDVLGWDRLGKYPKIERKINYTIRRIRLKAPLGIKIILYLPLWWFFEFIWLLKEKWDIVHVADFDTFLPALIVAKIKRKPIVYDIFDFYADMIPLPKFARWWIATFDKFFMEFADAVIIVDESIFRQIEGRINKNVIIIANTPVDLLDDIRLNEKSADKKREFTIFFLGALFEARYSNVDKVIRAIQNMDDVKLIIAGYGNYNYINKLKKYIESAPNAQYIGVISDKDAVKYSLNSDLLFALYDPFRLNNRYLSPNKLFESMMYAKPILVSENSTMSEKIQENNCGIAVNCRNVEKIKDAIIKLKNDAKLCEQLGSNGRHAYEEKYNWKIMEKRLLSLYDKLLYQI